MLDKRDTKVSKISVAFYESLSFYFTKLHLAFACVCVNMDSPDATFTLAYIVFGFCFVFTPNEFRSAGLTVQHMFSEWLGSEDINFIHHHIRRTTLTVLFHSFLPLGMTPVKTYFCNGLSIIDVTCR